MFAGGHAVEDAYRARFADPCNPLRSNDVVRAIGKVIDSYTAARPGIRNIVIIGDDRQIPMANIVDDTNFANERTFAQDFVGNDESIAALLAGMYRTDDPYGTTAGIRVRDHELFVPGTGGRSPGRDTGRDHPVVGQLHHLSGTPRSVHDREPGARNGIRVPRRRCRVEREEPGGQRLQPGRPGDQRGLDRRGAGGRTRRVRDHSRAVRRDRPARALRPEQRAPGARQRGEAVVERSGHPAGVRTRYRLRVQQRRVPGHAEPGGRVQHGLPRRLQPQ